MMSTNLKTRRRTRRQGGRRLGVAACSAVMSLACLSGCGLFGSDDPPADGDEVASHTGSDDHAGIDPVAEDPGVAATAVATSWLSYDPSRRISPCDIPDNVAMLQLTAKLAEQAAAPDSAECLDARPAPWDDWGAANAQVKAIITDTNVTENTDDRATVELKVTQQLVYPDGGRSRWATSSQTVELLVEDERWKATTITSTPKQPTPAESRGESR